MATWAGNETIFDARDAQLLDELGRARMLSSSQLQRLVGHGEPLGALVERLKRLAQGGWVKCLPRVAGPHGAVAAWHRADEPLPEDPLPVAEALLELNEVYAALRAGPRELRWSVQLGEPLSARLEVPSQQRRWLIVWGAHRASVRAACLHLGSGIADPESGVEPHRPEALVLCVDAEMRQSLRAELQAWQARFPGEPAPVRLATLDEGIRVLRALIHGDALNVAPSEPPVDEVTERQGAAIAAFLEEQR